MQEYALVDRLEQQSITPLANSIRFAEVCWTVEDVQQLYSEWHNGQLDAKDCETFLEEHEERIAEAMHLAGWREIDILFQYLPKRRK